MQSDINITEVVVIPSYNEVEALPYFLSELTLLLPLTTAIVIADDSPAENFRDLKNAIMKIQEKSTHQIVFSHHDGKGGRGAAVNRGFSVALSDFPNAKYLLECDADGSHQPSDVYEVMNFKEKIDLVIGSRYISGSKISNWPHSRRFFSKALNLIIPRVLGLSVRDVTNGLRRYSRKCAETIVGTKSINSGFIYLSEQAMIAARNQFTITEHPIHFKNRTHGESTVTFREITHSIVGVVHLVPLRMKKR